MTFIWGRKLPALLAIGFASALQSGAQLTARKDFEVASVKLVKGPFVPRGVGLKINHGRLTIDGGTLRQIVGLAYAVQPVRVQGGPGWLDSEQYDIAAKAEDPDTDRDQIRMMLQSLLADRFKLAVHRETKELDVYSLIVGKNGSKLQEAKEEEKAGVRSGAGRSEFQWTFQKFAITGLVNLLANFLDSPVVDRTGLEGFYDFKLTFIDRRYQRPASGGEPQPLDQAPDLFGALQEQAGLKLEKKKGPADVVVVDRAERASEN